MWILIIVNTNFVIGKAHIFSLLQNKEFLKPWFYYPNQRGNYSDLKKLIKDKFSTVEKMFLKFVSNCIIFLLKGGKKNWLIQKNDKPIILFCVLLDSKTTSCWVMTGLEGRKATGQSPWKERGLCPWSSNLPLSLLVSGESHSIPFPGGFLNPPGSNLCWLSKK